jgi:hypothetical protein
LAVPGFEQLPGTVLSEGTFTITTQEADDLASALESAPATDAGVHPIWAYIATQRGIDVSIAELCALADFDVEDGPMLGSVEIEYSQPLQADVPYRVTGEVVDLERKVGRKAGTFDLLTYRLALRAPDGSGVASCTNTFVLPRRDAA